MGWFKKKEETKESDDYSPVIVRSTTELMGCVSIIRMIRQEEMQNLLDELGKLDYFEWNGYIYQPVGIQYVVCSKKKLKESD